MSSSSKKLTRDCGKVSTLPSANVSTVHPLNILPVISDRMNSNFKYLIDTGASISLLPKHLSFSVLESVDALKIVAANGTDIKCYGKQQFTVSLPECRSYRWIFYVCDVQRPIIGSDFLREFHLLVDVDKCRVFPASDFGHQCNSIKDLLNRKFPRLTDDIARDPHMTTFVEHNIVTDGYPVYSKARRLDQEKLKIAKSEFEHLMKGGIIRRSSSPWASPLHMVKKPNGSWRLCGDYRKLNLQTIPDSYPLPHMHDIASGLHGCTIFSKIDLVKAFHQVPLSDESIPKTAIITPFGLFEYVMMPFGLRNASQTFQRFVDKVCTGLDGVYPYIDDILIASKDENQHIVHVKRVFERLQHFGLKISLDKCQFGLSNITFLGYSLGPDGIRPSPDRVAKIKTAHPPQCRKDLQRFMGLVNFYCRFMKDFATFVHPLHQLLKPTNPFTWSKIHQEAFDKCKNVITDEVVLQFQHPSAPLALSVDASNSCIGAVIEQNVKDTWRPLAFFSRKMTPAQQRYSAFDKELFAVKEGISHFRHFLEGRSFTVFTDHRPLISGLRAKSSDKWTNRQQRHFTFISEFTSDIRHISGKDNLVADWLSRLNAVKCDAVDWLKLSVEQSKDISLRSMAKKSKTEIRNIDGVNIIGDSKLNNFRPLVPKSMTPDIIELYHDIAHTGVKATQKLIGQNFSWPGMKNEIAMFVRSCLHCQSTKISRHERHPIRYFPPTNDRFAHVHADIVGPLPICRGYRYLLTMIDRRTRWFEAIPLSDITTNSCVEAILSWISRFGVPRSLTTDRGRQFTSVLWSNIAKLVGFKANNTTSYHPQSNGMVERLHRTLKTSLVARLAGKADWVLALPIVVLGLRASPKSDFNRSAAEMTYGENIRLPGFFFEKSEKSYDDDDSFLKNLKLVIDTLPTSEPIRHGASKRTELSTFLKNAKYVFVRDDTVKPPLSKAYRGPYLVKERKKDYFIIETSPGRSDTVSVDRLKAYFERRE